jgi:diguanylate cyclase
MKGAPAHGHRSPRTASETTAWALGAVALLLLGAGLVDVIVDGDATGSHDDVRHIVVFALAATLLLVRAATAPAARRIWLTFGLATTVNTAAEALSVFHYDGEAVGAAGVLYGFAYLLTAIALSLFLRRRVGDALRTFSFDVLGLTLTVGAVLSAILLPPILREGGGDPLDATLNVVFTSADIAIAGVVFAIASSTGRRRGRQDLLLAGSLAVMFAGDLGHTVGQTGWIAEPTAWVPLAWESSMLLVAATAWARPTAAASLRVGGWWESVPSLACIAVGGGVLVVASTSDLPGAVVVLGALAIAFGALRGLRIVQEVRTLVVQRAESLVDPLTGAGNYRALTEALHLSMREHGADGTRVALLTCHLEGFAELSETLGPDAAGELLRVVAQRLAAVAPAMLARLDGDVFAAIVEDADPEPVAARFAAALLQPVTSDGIAVSVRPVLGYARFPDDAGTPNELVRRAEVARLDAKDSGRDVAGYDPARDRHSRERLELAADLRAALGAHPAAPDGLWLAFQPQVDLDDGIVVGAEALIRWHHPTRGALSPAELLPVAERSGQMSALTDWVLERAVEQLAALRAGGHALRISINVSAATLVDVGLPDRIGAALARHGVPAELLVIEVTEDAVMRDHRRSLEVLGAIAALGVEISIDDFGTGHSSLAQLRHLPADELKIDRRFISEMVADPLDAEIVRLVIGLGRRMGLRVVAEGIESAEERIALERLGCDVIQGFGVGRPMAAADLHTWLKLPAQAVALRRYAA